MNRTRPFVSLIVGVFVVVGTLGLMRLYENVHEFVRNHTIIVRIFTLDGPTGYPQVKRIAEYSNRAIMNERDRDLERREEEPIRMGFPQSQDEIMLNEDDGRRIDESTLREAINAQCEGQWEGRNVWRIDLLKT